MAVANILLVEDDKLQAQFAKNFLESNGYHVSLAEDGKSALKLAKTEPIDVILLDLLLPDMDGNEVCRWLKLNQDTKGIPIIMLTVRNSMMEKVEGLKAGADDYLPKPYNEIELNARIYSCLRTKTLQDELRKKNRELEDILSKVESLAITDSLTGLYNRRYFETIIEKEFNRTLRYKSPIACLMIDVDYFKGINDKYGHRTGDSVLIEIATIIKDCLRKVDTVARWGGEEFVVLLPRTTSGSAQMAASRILSTIAGHRFDNIENGLTVSIGIANIPSPSIESAEKLIDAADSALYEAKTAGRNRMAIAP